MDETGNFSLPKSGVENGTQWRSCLNKIRHLALQEWVAFCSRKVVVPIAALVAKNLKVVPLLLASRAVLLNESAFGRHLWFSLSAKKTCKRCKNTWPKKVYNGRKSAQKKGRSGWRGFLNPESHKGTQNQPKSNTHMIEYIYILLYYYITLYYIILISILYYIVLYYIILYVIILYVIILYYIILHYIILYYTIL